MFNQEKICYKFFFAYKNNDSKINEILYSLKVNLRVINGKERFRFYIFDCLKVWQNFEIDLGLLKRRGEDNISRQIL